MEAPRLRRGVGLGTLLVLIGSVCSSAPAAERTITPAAVVAKIRTGSRPCLVAEIRRAVWVSNYGSDDLVRIDPVRNRIVGRRIRVGSEPCGLAFADGKVWVDGY